MNCDRIARFYRHLEYASFGNQLQVRRCHLLDKIARPRKVLMIGEGDGRALVVLSRLHPKSEIDYVDKSAEMLRLAARRVGHHECIRFYGRDVLEQPLPGESYDTVMTHFFLDCLSQQELLAFTEKVSQRLAPDAQWIISEFREPAAGWQRLRARLWIQSLYLAFGIITGLRTRRLPDHAMALRALGFQLELESIASAGLLTSQLWTRSSS
jgi:ubiquinone/menaquinone biosynthesis C-methylase UbiE